MRLNFQVVLSAPAADGGARAGDGGAGNARAVGVGAFPAALADEGAHILARLVDGRHLATGALVAEGRSGRGLGHARGLPCACAPNQPIKSASCFMLNVLDQLSS